MANDQEPRGGSLGDSERFDDGASTGMNGADERETTDTEMEGQSTRPTAPVKEERGEKQVPVSEAIRYRRRAQAAERTVETLQEQLERAEAGRAELARRVEALEAERGLTRRLVQAGARDLEAALLLARQRLGRRGQGDEGEGDEGQGGNGQGRDRQSPENVEQVVARLRREKPYLFVEGQRLSIGPATRTSGARESIDGRQAAVEQAAQRAKETGSMRDLCAYLRVRRGWL